MTRLQRWFLIFFLVVGMAALAVPSFAQTATPIPLVIDTNQIVSSSNYWANSFMPIFATAGGIQIGLALLSLVVGLIVAAIVGAMRMSRR